MKRLIMYLMITAGVSGCKAAEVNRAATLRQLLAVSNTVEAVEASVATNTLALTGHTSDTDNPHQVTLEQLGGLPDETDPVFTAWDKSMGISIKENQITDLKPYATETYVGDAIANIPPVVIPDETDPRAMKLYHYGDPDIEITPASAFTFNAANGTITRYTGTNPDVVVPYEIGGVPVVAVGANAFELNAVVKTLTAPKTLTTIGNYAFGGSLLTTLTAPSLTTIGASAFADSSLTTLTAPSLTSIGDFAFNRSSLTSLVAPALTSIGGYAFYNSSLTTIYYGGNKPTAGEDIYGNTPDNLVNYVTDPTATGWGATFGGKPVVRLPLYADEVYSGGSLAVTEATKELHQDTYTNLVWRNVFSNGWVWLVAYTNTPAGGGQ